MARALALLLALGAAGTARGDAATAVRALAGPFAELGAWCARARADQCPADDDGRARRFACPLVGKAPRVEAPAPLRAVVLFRSRCTNASETHHDERQHVAVRTDAGWFVFTGEALGTFEDVDHGSSRLTVEELTARDGHLVLRWRASGDSSHGTTVGQWRRRWLALIGVGPSGRPSATAPIRLSEHVRSEDHGDEPPRTSRSDFERPAGALPAVSFP